MRNRRRGFIGFRNVVALLIIVSILPLMTSTLSFVAKLRFTYSEINDELSLLQLRRILLIAYDVNNYGNCLEFIYHNDNYDLRLINNRLVLEPGYQMFLDNIDNLDFFEKGNAIYVRYTRGNKDYETPIIKQSGVYLDDFSDYYDDSNEYLASNE